MTFSRRQSVGIGAARLPKKRGWVWRHEPAAIYHSQGHRGHARRILSLGLRHRAAAPPAAHRDIIAALNGTVTPRAVGDALRLYVGNPRYLKACVTRADRIGLNGNPAGQVSAEDAASAKIRKKTKDAKWRERKQSNGKPVVVVEPIKSEPAPRRISLADLRAAAQARRAVA